MTSPEKCALNLKKKTSISGPTSELGPRTPNLLGIASGASQAPAVKAELEPNCWTKQLEGQSSTGRTGSRNWKFQEVSCCVF